MSEIGIDFDDFQDFSQYDPHFHVALSNAVNNSSHDEELKENKLYMFVDSLHGVPKPDKVFDKLFNVIYSLHVEIENEKNKKNLYSTSEFGIFAVNDNQKQSIIFDLVQYYGMTSVKLTLKSKNICTGAKSVVGVRTVTLSELVAIQTAHDISNNCCANWAVSAAVEMETSLLTKYLNNRSSDSISFDKNIMGKGGAWMPSSSGSKGGGIKRLKWSSIPVAMVPARVTVKFRFRLVALQQCLQLRRSLTLSTMSDLVIGESREAHMGSELHHLAAVAQSREVVDLMQSLATKQALAAALKLRSSEHCTPLDCALLAGNESVVVEILQRAGILCFRDMPPERGSPFHHAVRGGSKECLETLWRFFRKYSLRETSPLLAIAGSTYWCPTLSALLECRDEHGDTPLLLACKMKDRGHLVSLLLLCGCNIAALNKASLSPLMHACASGNASVVSVLLSIVKSAAEVDDNLFAVSSAVVVASHDNALQRHLRSNSRSRNLLKGRSPGSGGYMNPLSLFSCDPAHREDEHGRQAVHLAALGGYAEILEMVLATGVSCADADRHGDNVFHLLAKGGHVDAGAVAVQFERRQWRSHLELLRDQLTQTMHNRAQALNVLNYRGKSPIDVAVEGGHLVLAVSMAEACVEIYRDERSRAILSILQQISAEANCAQPISDTMVESGAGLPVSPSSVASPVLRRALSAEEEKEDSSASPRAQPKPTTGASHSVAAESKDTHCSACVCDVNRPPSGRMATLLQQLESLSKKRPLSVPTNATHNLEQSSGATESVDGSDKLWAVDDRADEQEYLFALSALALKTLGDSTASTMPLKEED